MTTRAARPIASLALTLALALLVVLGGLLTSPEAANADPPCEVPPSGLARVLNDAGSGIVLTWEASSCTPDEYALYRRNMDEAGSRMRLFATVDGASLSYTDTAVEPGVTYRYRIRSNDKGPRSASIEFTVPAPKSDADDTETSGETPRHHGGTNSDPAFGITSATRDMFENSAAETNVGFPVEAIDPDAGDTLTYSLSGTDVSSFTFDSSTGQITTKAGVTYNYEAKNSYSVSVSVRDKKDAAGHADTLVDDTIEVTVTVGDVDEPGTVVLSHSVPRVGSVQRARLNEDDAGVSDPTWRWHQSADLQTWTSIQGSNSHNFEPGSSLEGLYLRARARYRDKHGSGKTVEVISTEPVAAAEAAPTITVVELITGLSIPWGIAFAPDGTMLFTERPGVLSSRLTDGTVQAVTADLKDLFVDAEMGLLGIVVDPEFASNRRFYTCQSYRLDPPPLNPRHIEMRVVAWTINASYTEATRVFDPLVEGIPFGNRNTGCRLRFGPDGYLWVTTGDAGGETNAQDLTSLAGKVLRVDASTGAAAPGNPFAPSLVYSYGHRNPQGLALRPGTRQMWSVEHGPSQDDEINLVVSGANYGWQANTYDEGVMTDLKQFPDAMEARWSSGANTIATSGGIFLEGVDWGIWEGRLAVASLKNKSLRLFEFDAGGVLLSEHVVEELKNAYGRLRTPMVGPNGALYVSTSAGGGSDKILLVAPSQPPSFSSDSVTLDVQENSAAPTVVGTVTATDPEGKALTYTLSGPDADAFDIPNPSAGQLQTRESFDRETKDSYEVVIKATDNYGLSDSVTVTIDVTNIVELQPLTGPATVGYEENRAVRVATFSASSEEDRELLTWSLSGPDAGSFRIDEPAGVLRFDLPIVSPNLFSPQPDYEAPTDTGTDGAYELTVEVGDGVTTHSLDVAVTITDQDEAGTLTLSPTRPRQAELVTATLSDPDTVTGTPDWTWERSAGRNNWAVINGAISASYSPVAADTNTFLRVTATYDDEHGTGKSVEAVPPNVVTGPLLTGLTAESGGSRADAERQLTPTFEAETLHYRIGCTDADTLTLTASGASGARISVSGTQVASGSSTDVDVTGISEVPITVTDSSGSQTTYIVHCFPAGFPVVTTRSVSGASGIIEDLILFTPTAFIAIMDNNGVPRYLDMRSSPGLYFRFQQIGPHGDYRYSHSATDNVQVIRDENLELVRRVTTVSPLTVTNGHDQRVLDGDKSLLLAWQPATRDLSPLPFNDDSGTPWGTAVYMRDSAFQIVTPQDQAEFTWNSWGKVPLEDCSQHRFPDGYGHINSGQLVDGLVVVSLRGCSTVLAIDPALADSHKIAWRLGQTNLSEEDWADRAGELGPAPLTIINDPEGEFCGQHAAQIFPNGHLVLFDNGSHCVVNPWTTGAVGRQGDFSRALEYALDPDTGEAVFLRDHTFGGQRTRLGIAHGHVEVLNNGDWLISWGNDPRSPSPYPTSEIFTQVDPDTGEEKFGIIITSLYGSERATVMSPSNLAPQPSLLAAEFPPSSYTSVFHTGATDSPQVVVSFSRPVADFDETSPSLSVTGGTVTDVEPHVVAGEPAYAYLVTLTPDGDGAITLTLLANRSCSSGGICTADGARLSEVPGTYTIEAPVRVSFEETSFTATEGATASVMVSLSAPSGPFGITIPIVVTGGTASADEYSVPESVVFSSGDARQTVSIPLGDDALIEGDETISLAFGDLPAGVTLGTNATTTVTITDADSAAFEFAISDDEVGEGATVELTVTLDGGATFATAQTIHLTFQGGGASAGVDFTVTDARGQTLTAPYALTLPAGSSSVVATLSIVDDAEEEGDETILVSARHGADALGGPPVITILANDAPPPPTNSPPVFTEGRNAARSLAENTGPSINIGRPLAATDVDQGDTLTYSLGGPDAGSFDISLTSGQLRTKSGIVYDHEAWSSYRVTVTVSDGQDTATIDVDIAVTDVDEPPDAPVVQVDTASPVSLEVRWLAPATSGRPAVRDYDLRYKLVGESTFTDGPQDVSGTSASIGELIPASSYDVQVRATNAEGDGAWSASQPGETAVLPVVTLILSPPTIPENRGMSTVTATVSPASPTPFSVTVWAVAFPPVPGQFETSANSVLNFAANAAESTGEVVITGLVAAVVNVTGTVSPAGVLVKPPARVQLRITDVEPETDVDPEVAVRFGSAAYNVPEGGIRRISVVLDEDPERTVVIPITKTNQGGARSGDYSVNPDPTNVTFNAGGDLTQTFTFTATLDTVDDDGESVLLGFDTPNLPTRVSVGTTSQSTVRITDDDDPEVTVKFGASSINLGEGDSATITVTISADPERELQIPIMATGKNGADPTDFSRTPAVLIFPSGSTADRTFTVTATNDTVDDDGETVELSFGEMPDDRVSPDTDPDSHTSVTVTLVDNDDPLVTVSFQSDKYTVPESDDPATTSDTENEVTVSVVLDEDPERTVVIPITKTNQGGARSGDYSVNPDPANVTFNAGGDLTQTFTFTATPDTDDDDGESVLLGFGTMPDARVTVGTTSQSTVSITDDDDPEVTVKFGASSINVGEGDSATITVTISADPERTVVIPITKTEENGATPQGETGADYSGVPNSVIFTASGSQTFTLTATQDRIDDDNERVKLGFDTPNLPTRVTAANPTTQTINIGDDDERGVAITPAPPAPLSVSEGTDGEYTVALTSEPTAPVTVTPSTVSPEVTLVGLTSSGNLNFTTSNWATAQTVTVRAPEDGDAVSEMLTITHTVSGGDYGAVTVSNVAVSLGDNDVAGVAITPSNLTIRENATDTFTVKLNTEPGNDVTVTISSRDAAVATVSLDSLTFTKATSLTFTTSSWNSEQTVTVRGVEDDGAADNNTTITLGVSGYGSVTEAAPVTVTVEDDDERAVTISASTLTVEEEAAATDPPTNTYTVVLATQPEGNVTVAITSDNDDIRTNGGSATSASPYNLTFTSANWDQPQTVAVTAINDLDGWNEEATLTHAVSGADYEAVNANAVDVTVTDNDLLGLRVSPAEYTTERVPVNEGGEYSYTLALLTEPLGDVTVDITSNNPDVTVDPTKLTILAARWNAPHTVKITAAADPDGEDEPATLAHTVSGYGTYTTGPDFLVQVLDRNEPGVFIEPTTLAITEGFEDAYSVSLRTEPSGAVTVQVAGHAGTDVTVMPESLTFSSSDWNVPQAVTVTAAEDEDADNDTVTLTHTVSGYGTVTTADDVTVTIMEPDSPVTPVTPQGLGGGGGGPSGPTPSGIEFEWNVERDIEQLDSGHDSPTGAWSDGTLLWLAENGDGADDAVYAYDLATGERVEEREFELHESNRAPRGLWSDGKTAWVADSGQDRLFAYDLESGERDEEREVEFDTRNRDPRGIWSDGTTVWVLDGGKNALFAYDLASGELIAEYTLDPANGDPRGLWSDGVSVWVSDHDAKRLFAYRLAAQDAETTTGEDEEAAPLERARDEEFTELSRASNNSPRGIWSDGEVMYVADESDGRVYSYNLPGAIDARLASLTLGGVEFGEFDPGRTEYEGVPGDGVTETTVEAEAAQRGATIAIAPADAGEATDGHQLALDGIEEITVTVTSADESRTKVYLVRFGDASGAEQPVVACLRGAVTVGFSLLVAEGGSVEELVSCAESRSVTALYALHEGEYVSYILGAPAFVNSAFREVYSGGVPALTPLIAKSEGPPSADPAAGSAGDGEPWPLCLRGAIVEGFSLVLYEGGSVDALDACARSREVSAVYALHDGEYVSYILGAPDFVNAAFRELFAAGLPAVTPLVVKSN